MESLIPISATWWNLLVLALVLVGIFIGIGFLERLIEMSNAFRYVRKPAREIIRVVRILFEPVAVFLLAFVFVLINHLEHGALILLLIVISFNHLRNYVSGRILLLENAIQPGDEIKVGDVQGKILFMGRLGIKLRNQEGFVHLNFHRIFSDGYARLSSRDAGEYVTLEIAPHKMQGDVDYNHQIATLLAAAPYVDWHLTPSIKEKDETTATHQARVLLKKEAHLTDLISLLSEKGFLTKTLFGHFED